ncbi:MAG: hypothetical protein NVS9B10_18910 [Nevskia sp.]
MNITASAPGKLVLLGEYAVLEGAPAIAMAVNRRAIARISPTPGAGCEALAPDILAARVPFTIGADGCPDWQAAATEAAKLPLVDQVLRGLAAGQIGPTPASGFRLELDTREFFDTLGAADEKLKLGLGSSAALTVALASALVAQGGHDAATTDRAAWLCDLLALHRRFQGGQGSGVDVATSLIGGVISYRLADGGQQPVAQDLHWPESVQRLYVWSGRSASTPKLLGVLQAWRAQHPAEYSALMTELSAIAESAVERLAGGDGAGFVAAAAAYATALRALGAASGVSIYSEEHVRIGALAAEAGLVYKPCGAGGGDVGVVLALDDSERLEALRRRLSEAGFEAVPLAVDDTGLKLEFTEIDPA